MARIEILNTEALRAEIDTSKLPSDGLNPEVMDNFLNFEDIVRRYDRFVRAYQPSHIEEEDLKRYEMQIAMHAGLLKGIRNINKVVKDGFMPVSIPAEYFISRPNMAVHGLHLTSSIPEVFRESTKKLYNTGLIDKYVIAHQDFSHFGERHIEDCEKTRQIEDPMIVGFVAINANMKVRLDWTKDQKLPDSPLMGFQHEKAPGAEIVNGQGFLAGPRNLLDQAKVASVLASLDRLWNQT